MSEVTRILVAVEQGDPHAAERLLPLVYPESRTKSRGAVARMNSGVGWVVNHRRGQRQVFRAFADAQNPRFFRLPARTPSTGSTRLPYGTLSDYESRLLGAIGKTVPA